MIGKKCHDVSVMERPAVSMKCLQKSNRIGNRHAHPSTKFHTSDYFSSDWSEVKKCLYMLFSVHIGIKSKSTFFFSPPKTSHFPLRSVGLWSLWFTLFGSVRVNHRSKSSDPPLSLVTNHQLLTLFKVVGLYVSSFLLRIAFRQGLFPVAPK